MSDFKQKLAHYTWDIAYGVYSDKIITDGLKGVKLHVVRNPYKNKWFADPFILEENENSIQFLVEEFDFSVGRGRIARLKICKKSNKIIDCSIILDLPTHLSFPVIYRVDDEIYVHPENSASGASYIYQYDRSADRLVSPQIMVDEPVTDAIIREDGEMYRMYATRIPDTNGCTLHEYVSKSLLGPYRHVGENLFDKNTARMAGMFLTNAYDQIIRPAQNCFGGYGKAVIMYEGHKTLGRLTPTSYKYAGIHTFNTFEGTFVIDLKKYDYPLIYKLSRILKK